MSGYVSLGYTDLALAALFLMVNGMLSIWLGLGLERRLAVAAVRMFVQLSLVGLVLKTLFGLGSPWLTGLWIVFMLLFAGREVRARQENRIRGWWGYGIGGGAMALSAGVVATFALGVLVRPDPWWAPQYFLPLLGMILGNAMNGVSLGLNSLHRAIKRESRAIEAQLMLGATRWQAAGPFLRDALKTGFIPIINAMAATGIVSLPGMMSGQILSGIDPREAVKYQILVLLLIAGSTGIGVMLAAFGSLWRLTDERHRLRPDRLIATRDQE
jgi:UDP-glucose/iron transport system permease protein